MLNVIENGMRITTPWYSVFPPRSTEKLTPSASPQPISQNDQTRESTLPHPKIGQNTYQQVEHMTEKRHPVSVVKDIMSAPVISVSSNTPLSFAWSELQKHGIRHLPVLDGLNRLEGIITDRDILKAWAIVASENKGALKSLNVRQTMTIRVLTGAPETNIREIADAMTVRRIGAVPLLDENQHVVGIVTRSDILRAIVHQAPMDLWS